MELSVFISKIMSSFAQSKEENISNLHIYAIDSNGEYAEINNIRFEKSPTGDKIIELIIDY